LVVLNDIARWGNRILNNPAEITFYFDTNDDGRIEPLDALLVLNEIARRRSVGQGAAGEASSVDDEASSQPPLTAARDTPGSRKTPPKPVASVPPFGWLAGFREEDERDRLFAGLGQQNAADWLPGPDK